MQPAGLGRIKKNDSNHKSEYFKKKKDSNTNTNHLKEKVIQIRIRIPNMDLNPAQRWQPATNLSVDYSVRREEKKRETIQNECTSGKYI